MLPQDIIEAIESGDIQRVTTQIQSDDHYIAADIIRHIVRIGSIHMMRGLIQQHPTNIYFGAAIHEAIRMNDETMLKFVLWNIPISRITVKDGFTGFSVLTSDVILVFLEPDINYDLIPILLEHPGVDPNSLFESVIFVGRYYPQERIFPIVEVLLRDPRVDPMLPAHRIPILDATDLNMFDVVDVILYDSRIWSSLPSILKRRNKTVTKLKLYIEELLAHVSKNIHAFRVKIALSNHQLLDPALERYIISQFMPLELYKILRPLKGAEAAKVAVTKKRGKRREN